MTNVTKLISELEAAAEAERPSHAAHLMHLAAETLKELTIPREGLDEGDIPYKIITELYNSAVRGTHLPAAKGLTAMRRRMIAQRWQEDKERRTIEWWTNYFKRIAASDFLAGRTPPTPGHENWRPNLDWFIKPGNMIKVLEGSYDNRGARTNVEAIQRFR